MKIFTNRSWVGPSAPAFSMARDVVRIVITAVLAGTGFALLLALTVLSLTVIAPPAGASALAAGSSGQATEDVALQTEKAADQTSGSFLARVRPSEEKVREAVAEGVFGSLPGLATPVGWALILAMLAGALAFIVYVRRKV